MRCCKSHRFSGTENALAPRAFRADESACRTRVAATTARQDGQATVEFALVLPTFILVVVAVCQVALFLNCYMVVTASSREGARRGAETNDAGEARSAALRSCSGLPGAEPQVSVDFPDGRSKGKAVRVTVTYRVPLLLPGVSSLLGEPSFSRSTSMALERGEL